MSSFLHLRCHVVKFLTEFNPPHALSETIYSGLHTWSQEWNLVGLLVQQNPVNVWNSSIPNLSELSCCQIHCARPHFSKLYVLLTIHFFLMYLFERTYWMHEQPKQEWLSNYINSFVTVLLLVLKKCSIQRRSLFCHSE